MSQRFRSFILVVGDYGLFFLALLGTLLYVRTDYSDRDFVLLHLKIFAGVFVFWSLCFYIEGLYSLRTTRLKSLSTSLFRSLTLAVLGSVIFFYVFPYEGITPKRNLLSIAGISFFLTWFWHWVFRQLTTKLLTRVALWGDERSVELLRVELARKPYLGFQVQQVLHQLEELRPEEVDLVVVARQHMTDANIGNGLLKILERDKSVMELGRFTELVSGKIPLHAIDQAWFLEACGIQVSSVTSIAKNVLDKAIAFTLLLFVIPLYAVLLPLLFVVSGRPLFFGQIRTGHLNVPFKIWKLRTMVVNAEKDGAQWAKPGDSRVTPVGRFLRMTRLDELPQLWNILKGDMSIVGPRPERPEIIEKQLAPAIPFYNQRHLVKPGVTGWAQVNFRYGFSQDDALEKLQYDLYYVKNQSLTLDLRILLRTIKTVLTGAGQ